MTPAISLAGITRRYRGDLALDHVSFDIAPGSVTGLLGRNGAGKTTLLRIIAGQEFPSAGTVWVLGGSPVTATRCCAGWCSCVRTSATRSTELVGFHGRACASAASWFYPDWDAGLAFALLDDSACR